ncbi:glucose-6-phosphate dehydrogenase [Dethiosulfatarculus sandiegensis]|uniref:glucose-6-phosphate dehydrogenase n=1 Tax=Dethiosulfatarculus sandiegensis TaxID=1429043 RepID=UPI0009EAE056|nr:glucose-6-phosphate dehydrogenase [Dethiosulfatarculus sandiegensis]
MNSAETPPKPEPALVREKAHDNPPATPGCLLPEPLQAAGIVIFGASGDLAWRKLVPALFNLYDSGHLPDQFFILGVSRTNWDDREFRGQMQDAVTRHCDTQSGKCSDFLSHLYYHRLEYDQPEDYKALATLLKHLGQKTGAKDNLLFNLALPPSLPPVVSRKLAQAGLSQPGPNHQGWIRVVVEKPFGHDLESSRYLNQTMAQAFSEDQIFRVDHYLAKETVQNIIMFRFANAIFEPIWNRNFVDKVVIIASEKLGVGHRAGYYEGTGVLRDMFQNHMLQLLSLTAMEPPSMWAADRVRDEKTKVFRSLRPFTSQAVDQHLLLGQYGAGKEIKGYRQESGVAQTSLTPTFAMLKVYVDNWRWQGVPFYLVSGKRMAQKVTRMVIFFRQVPHSMFRQVLGQDITQNRLFLNIHPEEAISLSFQTKGPGPVLCLRTVRMVFDYAVDPSGLSLGAYEKALLDCMQGEQMLFWRQDGVELCWSFLEPVLNRCESCGDRASRLHTYTPGSWGPEEVKTILPDWPEPAL